MRTDLPDSFNRPPEVYALGAQFGNGFSESMFAQFGWSLRGFGDKEAYHMLEEFTAARPRPALLIAQTCGYEGTGLSVAKQCREIEAGLKLIVWSAHKESTLEGLFRRYPVAPDVRLPLLIDPFVLIWHADKLLREAGLTPAEGNLRLKNAIMARISAGAGPLNSHVRDYENFQVRTNWPEKSRIYQGKPDGD